MTNRERTNQQLCRNIEIVLKTIQESRVERIVKRIVGTVHLRSLQK